MRKLMIAAAATGAMLQTIPAQAASVQLTGNMTLKWSQPSGGMTVTPLPFGHIYTSANSQAVTSCNNDAHHLAALNNGPNEIAKVTFSDQCFPYKGAVTLQMSLAPVTDEMVTSTKFDYALAGRVAFHFHNPGGSVSTTSDPWAIVFESTSQALAKQFCTIQQKQLTAQLAGNSVASVSYSENCVLLKP